MTATQRRRNSSVASKSDRQLDAESEREIAANDHARMMRRKMAERPMQL